jgi:hypothetical protein
MEVDEGKMKLFLSTHVLECFRNNENFRKNTHR